MKMIDLVLIIMIGISLFLIGIKWDEIQMNRYKSEMPSRIFMYEYDESYRVPTTEITPYAYSPLDADFKPAYSDERVAIVVIDSPIKPPPKIIVPDDNTTGIGAWKRIDK